jgi:multidrug resistance efflux pump
MRSGKILIYIAWLVATIFLVFLTLQSKDKVDSFLGLTESQETNMNFPFPVQIKKIHVYLGQEVKKGDKLAEIIRLDVDTEISTKNYKIAELVSKQELKKERLKADLETLEIKKNKDLSEIEFQIKTLKEREKQNKDLMKSIGNNQLSSNGSIIRMIIETLQQKHKEQTRLYKSKIENILSTLNKKNDPITAQIRQLENKIDILKQNRAIITVYAPYDADIGTISKTEGESIKAFSSIINLHPLYPSYITGYIHEDISTNIKIGQKVVVKPLSKLSNNKKPVIGEIQSISTRIVGFPVRLKKFKIVPLWGYKVLINIPKSDLKLGQKVIVAKQLDQNDTSKSLELFNILDSIKLH